MAKSTYHHGDLRAALLAVAAEQIAAGGVDSVSLRELARRAGVSHAAPAHHFGDRRGLLTELAVEGFGLLADALAAAPDLRERAIAYVRFALAHPGHFEVMFRRDLLRPDDPRLADARARSGEYLRSGTASPPAALAAWSLVHGFASLWREGALAGSALATDSDPQALARLMVGAIRFE
ncbi:TetR/AcrR family transcriptional regulator [Actinokineospora fastidiosa]|uniref:TetR-family transcriptional regulator n=1 Tax=Actinokineospora fastidiosa TaxID=1816 RepID=A0A918GI53_9PSEU|nr:TetR/AcrR family transcriptional regulator [Actinokineospora fastidiosa]GGS34242.1 putative TetR-family transcriptional regulator [Actinokineospora fastidiosa]